tara:strand:- start:24 stop:392 length:369 start_codon:yes stop_codon:yes gene_type:complete
VAVACGGAIGATLRFVISAAMQKVAKGFPAGTMLVNVLGCLLLGLLLGATNDAKELSPAARNFLAVGLLGSFTTFATFSAEAIQLMRERQHAPVLIYVVGSVILGLLCVLVGHELALKFTRG